MATNTKNYNFKKPDESDFYDIQDQNGNWDIADEKMEELSAPTFEDYSGTTSVPEASTAIEAIKSKKKIPEILANIKAAFKGVCLLGHIVNNCVTDNARLPLSAAQGKVLMDAVTKLNSDLKNTISSNGTVINPNIAKSVLTVFDGWDSNAANYNSFFKNKMSILITVWVWNNTIGNLEAERAQCMIHSSKIMYRYYDYNHNWSEWG